MSDIEGIGEAVTGGLLASAIEPRSGAAAGGHGGHCLNCGEALIGPYCQSCGQPAHIHRTLGAFGHDLLHGVLHFEGKMWRTLPLLAWRPGELTRRYIDGERAKFVSPIAMFLFSVFLMFAVLSLVGGPLSGDSVFTEDAPPAEVARDLEAEAQGLARQKAELEQQRGALAARGQPTAAVDARIADLAEDLQGVSVAGRIVRQVGGTPAKGDNEPLIFDNDEEMNANTGWPKLDAAIRKAAENPGLLAYKLQANAYKFSWALIPISVPFVWLLFLWRRQYRAYDHMVFVTYSIAAMTLMVIALSLLQPIVRSDALAGLAFTFIPPIHIYRQLRGGYRLGWFSALWRTMALLFFASFATALFFLLLVAIGVLG